MKKLHFPEKISIIIISILSIFLIGLQLKPQAWSLLILGLIFLLFCRKKLREDFLLLYLSLSFLGLTQINTNLSFSHIAIMGLSLLAALVSPYLISKYIYKENKISFKINFKTLTKKEVAYLIVATLIVYLILPFYLKSTEAYLNWDVSLNTLELIKLFISINAVVLWDELFFIATVLTIYKNYMPFIYANISQSIIFTSFLYELGYTSWGPIIIFAFAFIQGYIFKKTNSLFYIILLHLVFDLILFFALINSYYPNLFNFFIT